MLIQKKRLMLSVDETVWMRRVEQLKYFQFVPVDNEIAKLAVYLPDLHPDPADRIIAATARILGATLITRDDHLLSYPHIATVW